MTDGVRRMSVFVGMLASICWIFLVMLCPLFCSSRGRTMPFDQWVIVAAGLIGAAVSFFAGMAIVRGIAHVADKSRKDKTKS
ncbi:MAG: hypothetical protein P8Z71_04665 [Candidatus Sulfobium sp.]